MSSSSRPKRETKEPDRFTPWEEGVTSIIGVKVAGSRERKKNKQHMKQYRANKEASKDTEGKEDEVVQEEVDVVEMVEEEGPGGGDAKKKSKKKLTEVLVKK